MSGMRDAIVIGAGPAGLTAATLLAESGADVLLVDEQAAPGGQIYREVEHASLELRRILGPDYTHGAALAAAFRASGATYRPESTVWQVTADRELWLSHAGRSEVISARAIIIATGAMERPVPIPGWTLPGVMTAGAVQILLKTAGIVPERLMLAGSGPLLYLLAAQCIAAGVKPAGLVDTTSRAGEQAALLHLPRLLGARARRMVQKGLALKWKIRRAGVPVWRRATGLRIDGKDRAERISFRAGGRGYIIKADLIALHEGVIPHQQMTRAIGCDHEWDTAQRCFRPVLDAWGNTSVPGILVVGDGGGIGGAVAAELSGRLAAFEVLRRMERISEVERNRLALPLRRAEKAELAIRPFLDALYRPRREILLPPDEVMVCRCEEITAAQVRAAAREGAPGPNQAKSFLRAGMGPCQGRLCGPVVTELLADALGQPPGAVGYYRIRPPLKPVTIGELAALDPVE
jgi:NADPH-dependent 2,4-dienoyl-CoA reductase/sulfur reductase-like enzyme